MKNSNFVFILIFLLYSFSGYSQQEETGNQTLNEQFNEMLESSETYTEYKVIKRTTLGEFSRAVQDSLSESRSEIAGLNSEVSDLNGQVSQLTTRISDLEAQLEESERLRESLAFLGIEMNKATYHTLVWIIIGGLVVFGVFAYTSFIRSNRITSKTRKEIKEIELEFEEHRKKSHEKQIKMGRELQTERNLVEELRTKLKAKPSAN
jgi:hypothetical protein